MKLLHITDLHSGVQSVSAKSIHNGLEETFFGSATYADVDALCITGDFFDEALDYSSEDSIYAQRSITLILKWCKRHNVVCFVLEGTRSHDRNQSRWFEEINELHDINAVLYYFRDLTVKYIPELDIDLLAVPDELAKPRIKVDAMIKAKLKESGKTTVHLALTHGYYDFHLPKHEKEQGHSSAFFKKIVQWITLNGHVHTPTLINDILTGGSFSRTRHGEEERKGGHIIDIDAAGNYTVTFIENKILVPFKTIIVKKLNSDKLIEKIEKTIKGWTVGNLRLHYKRNDDAHLLINYLRDRYPHVVFSTKVDKLELEVSKDLKHLDAKISAISLDKDNLPNLIREGLLAETNDPVETDRIMARLTEAFL